MTRRYYIAAATTWIYQNLVTLSQSRNALFDRREDRVLQTAVLTSRLPLCRLSTMGTDKPRMTTQTLAVLAAFTMSRAGGLSGSEIAKTTKLKSGTLYPVLFRLEQAKWLDSKWEREEPSDLGRPRRRIYRLTGLGEKAFQEERRKVSGMVGGLVWDLS
jgi:DNA-binding MarR family transcriptional regulator